MSGDLALKVCQGLGVPGQFLKDCQAHFQPKLSTLPEHATCQKASNPPDCYAEAINRDLRKTLRTLNDSQTKMYSRWGLLSKFYSIKYNPGTDPFAPDDRIRKIARELKAQGGDMVQHLFDRLHRGGPEGVRTRLTFDFGKTAVETLWVGGDCSDLSNLTIAVIKELNRLGADIQGGAKLIHFQSSPPKEHHIAPYILREGRQILVDLQATKLGETGQGGYQVLRTFSNFDESASIYHLEWGNYFKNRQDWDRAIAAYERSLALDPQNTHTSETLAQVRVKKIAPQIKDAADRENWSQCIRLSQEALKWVGQFPKGEKATVEKQIRFNLDACRANRRVDMENARIEKLIRDMKRQIGLAERAYQERRWEDCQRHWTRSIRLNQQLPQDDKARQRTKAIQGNLELCKNKGVQVAKRH